MLSRKARRGTPRKSKPELAAMPNTLRAPRPLMHQPIGPWPDSPSFDNRRTPMAKGPKKLDELFHDTLKDIYFAEKKILSTLPKMAKAAHSEELKAAFEKHHGETEGQIERLEKVFASINQKPQGKTCAAIVGITDEG